MPEPLLKEGAGAVSGFCFHIDQGGSTPRWVGGSEAFPGPLVLLGIETEPALGARRELEWETLAQGPQEEASLPHLRE